MKKLLLVMLVPVLVLGFMGCGAKVTDGDTTPLELQGVWFPQGATDVAFVLTGNQATVFKADYGGSAGAGKTYGNVAYRTSYSGADNFYDAEGNFIGAGDPDAVTFKLEFYWFEAGGDQLGTITATFDEGAGSQAADNTIEVKAVQLEYNYQNVIIPAIDTYGRS